MQAMAVEKKRNRLVYQARDKGLVGVVAAVAHGEKSYLKEPAGEYRNLG